MNKYYVVGALALLQGCGGSSGSSGSSSTNVVLEPSELIVRGDLSPAYQESVALIASVNNDSSDQAVIKWTQTAGPSVELLSDDTAVIAFDLASAGTYEFSVSYTTSAQQMYTKTVSYTTSTSANILNVRRDQVARAGSRVSLKLSAPRDEAGDVVAGDYSDVVWEQMSGPSVTLDAENTNPLTAIFTAPSVSSDQLVSFSVSATHPNGDTHTDTAYVFIQDIASFPSSAYFDETVTKIKPFNANAPRANALTNCVYSNYFASPCSFSQLNLIGQDHTAPTVDDIMDRVIVSHQWMGENFKAFLENEDPHGDFKRLLRSVSAVVIAYDIRPSFYWGVSGAIYLDPEDLWLTPTQRDVIDVAPDYRSSFGSDLQYIMPWRYVKNNDYASSYYPKDLRLNRTTADLVPDLGSLLYHELAHANDFMAVTTFGQITEPSILEEINKRFNNGSLISDALNTAYPKHSDEMVGLATVNFHGESASTLQKSYLPSDIVGFYADDSAAMEYGYSSVREDAATLFDATMMSARYGIERDEAITPPYDSAVGRDSLMVAWGQRGRVKAPHIEPRVKYVLERIMPSIDADALLASLPAVQQMPTDENWYDAIDLSNGAQTSKRKTAKTHASSRYLRPLALDLQRRYK